MGIGSVAGLLLIKIKISYNKIIYRFSLYYDEHEFDAPIN